MDLGVPGCGWGPWISDCRLWIVDLRRAALKGVFSEAEGEKLLPQRTQRKSARGAKSGKIGSVLRLLRNGVASRLAAVRSGLQSPRAIDSGRGRGPSTALRMTRETYDYVMVMRRFGGDYVMTIWWLFGAYDEFLGAFCVRIRSK
jgi:hypothetical protein